MTTQYVIEESNGNPRILQRQSNGTYTVLTHGAGEKTVDDLIVMVNLANEALGES